MDIATQAAAVGDLEKIIRNNEKNPVLTAKDLPRVSKVDFRDPKKIWKGKDGNFYCGYRKQTGRRKG